MAPGGTDSLHDGPSIAIDGPVASGKTAVGRCLAVRLGCRFLDTGIMYRAVTLAAIDRGVDLENEAVLTNLAESLDMRFSGSDCGDRLTVDGKDVTGRLRDSDVDRMVSLAARASGVRSALVRRQQSIAREGPIVMAGRDIGTVVLPDADVKIYLEASPQVRSLRRYEETKAKGDAPDYQQLERDVLRRDAMDSRRADSPLRPAADALRIDTDDLSPEQVVDAIMEVAGLR